MRKTLILLLGIGVLALAGEAIDSRPVEQARWNYVPFRFGDIVPRAGDGRQAFPDLAGEPEVLLWETFDASQFPASWTCEPAGAHNWKRVGGGLHGWFDDRNGFVRLWWDPVRTADQILITPIIDCSGHHDINISFWSHFWPHGSGYTGYVEGSIDGGATWPYLIRTYHSKTLSDSLKVSYELPWADGRSEVRIRWRGNGSTTRLTGWGVDQVLVSGIEGVIGNDMAAMSIDNLPFYVAPGAVFQLRATVENRGMETQRNVPVILDITGPEGYTFSDTVHTGMTGRRETEQVRFDWPVSPEGGYYYTGTVRTGLVGDERPENDAIDFELNRQSFSYEFPPVGWTRIVTNTDFPDRTWHRGIEPILPDYDDPYKTPPAGAGVAWWITHQDEWLISSEFLVPEGGVLTWWYYGFRGSDSNDHYYTKITTDNGTTWDVLYNLTEQEGGWNKWETPVSVPLDDYAGRTVKLAFHAEDPPNNRGLWFVWFIDDVQVSAPSAGIADRGGPTGRFEPVRLYPNPTAGRTDVRFALPHHSPTQVRVFAVDGTLVRTLTEGMLAPGRHILTWDGTDDTGRQVSRGVYYVRVNTTGFTGTEKLVRVQ